MSITLLDERVALRSARLVMATRPPEPERSASLRAAIARDLPAIDVAVRRWTGLGEDLPPTTCRVVSRPGWVRANLAGLRGALDPLADRFGARPKLAARVMGVQLGALLGLLSSKVLGQFVVPLGSDGPGQLLVVGPNLLELEDAHGDLAGDMHRAILLHEVTHRLQFDGVPWLGGHLRDMVAGYLEDTRIDARRLADAAARLPRLAGDIRATGSVTPIVEMLMSPRQRELLDQAQGLMSLLEGHGMTTMYAATAGIVDDPAAVRAAMKSRPPDLAARVLTAVAGLERKREQYRHGEAFVDEVVAAVGVSGLNHAFLSPQHLPTVEEVADPQRWIERVGLAAA